MKEIELEKMKDLREFIEDKMRVWKVPGLAIGIVKKGQVLFCEGFGKRNIEKNLKVTPNTIFPIGSATKAFTTLSLGILVDEGKLDWDRPVRDYIKEFKMFDSSLSEKITVRDMACHRSGLPRHDLMWYNSSFSRKEMVERIQYLEPNKEFRTKWQYQNLMYIALGYMIEKITGITWEEFVQLRIFNELDMMDSNFSVIQSQTLDDYSLPYIVKNGEIIKKTFKNIAIGGPAGSINSNLIDMLKWLMLHLNKGKVSDKQLISKSNLNQTHLPQIIASVDSGFKEFLYSTYGLGWFVDIYRGYRMIHHDGNIDGFTSLVTFMPEEELGIVILTNMNITPLHMIISFNIYERLLGLNQIDWSSRLKNRQPINKQKSKNNKNNKTIMISKKKKNSSLSHELKDYIGEFKHPGYGVFKVVLDGEKLKGIFNSLEIPLTHYQYDIFEGYLEPYDIKILISFYTDNKGNVSKVSLPFEPRLENEISFSKYLDKRNNFKEEGRK